MISFKLRRRFGVPAPIERNYQFTRRFSKKERDVLVAFAVKVIVQDAHIRHEKNLMEQGEANQAVTNFLWRAFNPRPLTKEAINVPKT